MPAQAVKAIKGSVPGDLITDLQAASLVGDPLFELNFKNATMWDHYTWTYSTTFRIAAPVLERLRSAGSGVLLVFDGVKMGAVVKVDGIVLGQTTDQFLRYTFPLSRSLLSTSDINNSGQAGTHSLTVEFSPSIDCDGRWMGCSGGWDWAGRTSKCP